MRKIFCVVLALIICSFSFYSFAEDQNTTNINSTNSTNTTSSNISDLQDKQQELQNQIQQTDEELTGVKDELTENLEQVQKLDEKIETSEKELEELNQKIDSLSSTIEKTEEKLEIVNNRYEKQKKLLNARLISMYESGETQYLDVILSSSDLSEFLSSYSVVTELASYDKELLDGVSEKKEIIEIANERLTENLEQLSIMKKSQITNSKILQNTKTLRENYIKKLSKQEQEIQAKIDEYKEAFEKVNKEILEVALTQGLTTDYIGGVMAWPVPGYTKITSNYGMRTHPITGVYKLHTGVDISAPMGANFVAANDGIVTKAYYNSAYGNMVMIDHGGGISTLYAHGSKILVKAGQTVTRGEAILKVGSTGYSTGPHAHFEVRINGVVTNPIDYITKSKIPESVKKDNTNTVNESNTTNTVSSNTTGD